LADTKTGENITGVFLVNLSENASDGTALCQFVVEYRVYIKYKKPCFSGSFGYCQFASYRQEP
jgi:hypothetical protein